MTIKVKIEFPICKRYIYFIWIIRLIKYYISCCIKDAQSDEEDELEEDFGMFVNNVSNLRG